ncbi:MAG TPA: DUF1501 domain-containing protein [Isosphaeraceae bacterium]|nr:DUF1501 domain-containing protein [Isosphaeraceae bacterium]
MLSFLGRRVRLCDDLTRREVLRVGGLGFSGLLWPDLLRGRAADLPAAARTFGKARSCIPVFNYGGLSHLDLWDLKPGAPREVRGEFDPVATRIPGTSISEHLPRLAAVADRYAILRSVGHPDNEASGSKCYTFDLFFTGLMVMSYLGRVIERCRRAS